MLMAVYVVASYVAAWLRSPQLLAQRRHYYMPVIYDAVTFTGSSTVLMGIIDPNVLVLLGDTTLFLLIAAVGGLLHAFLSLWPPERLAADGDHVNH